MTVYVDNPATVGDWWARKNWCHMMSPDLDELHDMANKIGLKRSWFQNHRIHPHYDLSPGKRCMAVISGAVPTDAKVMLERCSNDVH